MITLWPLSLNRAVEPAMPPIAALSEKPQKSPLGAAAKARKSNVRHTGILQKLAVSEEIFPLRQLRYIVTRQGATTGLKRLIALGQVVPKVPCYPRSDRSVSGAGDEGPFARYNIMWGIVALRR